MVRFNYFFLGILFISKTTLAADRFETVDLNHDGAISFNEFSYYA